MTDDLRTQITKVLGRHLAGQRFCLGDIADAVIAELGLREERVTTDWPFRGKGVVATRLLSDWKHVTGCGCGWCER